MIETELTLLISPLKNFISSEGKLDGFYELFEKYKGKTLYSILTNEQRREDFTNAFMYEMDKIIQDRGTMDSYELENIIECATKFLGLYAEGTQGHSTYWAVNCEAYTLSSIIVSNGLDVSIAVRKLIKLTSLNMEIYKLSTNDTSNLFNILEEWGIDTTKVTLHHLANQMYDFRDKELKSGLSESSIF